MIEGPSTGAWLTERKRLVPDRFKRIWAIADFIAGQPGATRSQLAEAFALSERQIQADLNVMRDDLGLPILRREGYRFAGGGNESAEMGVRDVATLAAIMQRAWQEPTPARDQLLELARRLPTAFPAHLRALATKAIEPPEATSGGPAADVFLALLDAVVEGRAVRVHYRAARDLVAGDEAIIEPQILMPYRDSWYLIGQTPQRQRLVMVCVDTLESADFAPA